MCYIVSFASSHRCNIQCWEPLCVCVGGGHLINQAIYVRSLPGPLPCWQEKKELPSFLWPYSYKSRPTSCSKLQPLARRPNDRFQECKEKQISQMTQSFLQASPEDRCVHLVVATSFLPIPRKGGCPSGRIEEPSGFFLCVRVFACIYVYAPSVRLVPAEVRRAH